MKTEKYSPKWLLEKIKNSKGDGESLLHIIEFQNNIVPETPEILMDDLESCELCSKVETLTSMRMDVDGNWLCQNCVHELKNAGDKIQQMPFGIIKHRNPPPPPPSRTGLV